MTSKPIRHIQAICAMAALLACALGSAQAQPVQVTGAWARATAPGQNTGVAYLTITSREADRLVALSSPDAAMAMLHATTQTGGMSGMEDMDSVAVPAGGTVRLAPRGMHVMLMDLKHPLAAGSQIGLDLHFAKAGAVHVQVPVQPIGAAGPPG
jgi:copper(I)-binding protein